MSIRFKIVGGLTAAVALFSLAMYLVPILLVEPEFARLESLDAQDDLMRSLDALQREIDRLNDYCRDYATWDSLYNFAEAFSAHFAQENFGPQVLRRNRIEFLQLLSPEGTSLIDETFDPISGQPLDSTPVAAILERSGTVAAAPGAGLVQTPRGVLMVSSHPVRDTAERSPSRGLLRAGRFLTPERIESIARQIYLELETWSLQAGPAPPEAARQAVSRLEAGEKTVTVKTGDDRIAAYGLVKDVFGRPLLLVGVTQPRDIVNQGARVIRLASTMAIAGGVVLLMLLIVALRHIVVSPLARLASDSLGIARSGDFSARLVVERVDEIGALAAVFNKLLGSLAKINDSLEERVRRASIIYEKAIEAIIITDTATKILYVNPAFTAISGYEPEEVVGRKLLEFRSDRHNATFYEAMWRQVKERDFWSGEIWNRRKNGELYPGRLTLTASRDGLGRLSGYLAVFHDLSDLRRSEERLRHTVGHDGLTGLPNRQVLEDRLAMSLTRARRDGAGAAIFFVGLDRFKSVNDSLGYLVGDAVLKEAAMRLRGLFREEDTVGRFGGDEFVIVWNNALGSEVGRAVQRVLAVCAEPFEVEGKSIHLSGSLGAALFPADGSNPGELLKNADMALDLAKKQGRGSFQFFTGDMQSGILRRIELESAMRRGLAAGEFSLHYQPKVLSGSRRLVGAEALMRWKRPNGPPVGPQEFVAVAEECGLIHQLGELALVEACRQVLAWRRMGHADFTMAVNVSARQMAREGFVEMVQAVMEATGCPSENLELEITESALISDLDRNLSIVRRLKDRGVDFSLDDFGTGYSSLSYLKSLPLGSLKIDRSFIMDVESKRDSQAIVAAVVSMAGELGLKVVAEGVENEEQLCILRELDPTVVIQGYYFGKPCPPEEFAEFFETFGPCVQD